MNLSEEHIEALVQYITIRNSNQSSDLTKIEFVRAFKNILTDEQDNFDKTNSHLNRSRTISAKGNAPAKNLDPKITQIITFLQKDNKLTTFETLFKTIKKNEAKKTEQINIGEIKDYLIDKVGFNKEEAEQLCDMYKLDDDHLDFTKLKDDIVP